MKRLAAVVLAMAVLTGCGSTARSPVVVGGETHTTAPSKVQLPDVTLQGLGDEKSLTISGLRGTPTVINLWASWCGPCKAELPLLARASDAYGKGVRFIGIDFDDQAPGAARALAKSAGVSYELYADPKSQVRKDLQVIGLPQTVFVDAQGTIVATERKAFRSSSDLSAAIEKNLGVKP